MLDRGAQLNIIVCVYLPDRHLWVDYILIHGTIQMFLLL